MIFFLIDFHQNNNFYFYNFNVCFGLALLSFLVSRMHELGISPQERKVFFGQLLGMSDAVSFTLGMIAFLMSDTSTDN